MHELTTIAPDVTNGLLLCLDDFVQRCDVRCYASMATKTTSQQQNDCNSKGNQLHHEEGIERENQLADRYSNLDHTRSTNQPPNRT